MIASVIALGDAGPPRRVVLAGAVGSAVAISLSGCGIRLERDAPRVPGLKTQGPPPDQAVLLASLRSLQRVLRGAEDTPTNANPWVAPVRAAHRAQITQLVDVCAGLGIEVPSATGSATPSPRPSGTPAAAHPPSTTTSGGSARTSSSTAAHASARRLADAEASYPKAASEARAWAASAANRPMLVSVCAARRAAQVLLGGPTLPGGGSPPASVSAVPIARAVRPAVYGFEQIAGRTPVDARDQVAATLRWLIGARDALGPVVAEPERTSYRLPVRVTDTASARRLARALLADVLTATAAECVRVGTQGSGAQRWTLRIWSLAAADHARWGAPLAPFPGLRT